VPQGQDSHALLIGIGLRKIHRASTEIQARLEPGFMWGVRAGGRQPPSALTRTGDDVTANAQFPRRGQNPVKDDTNGYHGYL